jgi:hypothetical protein
MHWNVMNTIGAHLYISRHLLRDDGTQEVPKHAVDCVICWVHTYSLGNIFCPKIVPFMRSCEKNMVVGQAIHADVIRSMHGGWLSLQTHNLLLLLLLPGAELPSWKFWPSQRLLSTSLWSWTQAIQFLIFIWQMSCLMLSSHLHLGLPCDLLVRSFQLNIFLTVLVSGIFCMWPNQLSLSALMTDTHSEYVILIAFPLQQELHQRAPQ